MRERLEAIQRDFGISKRQIVVTVTDNGSNFERAFQDFGINDTNVQEVPAMQSSGDKLLAVILILPQPSQVFMNCADNYFMKFKFI